MTILALDIASKVGWAVNALMDGQSDIKSGAFHRRTQFGTQSFANGDYGSMGHRFGNWLADKIDEHKPSIIAVERPFYRGAGSHVYMLNGMAWTAQMVAYAHEIERREYTVWDVRKALFGEKFRGGTKKVKQAVMDAIVLSGFSPQTDDEADAIALLLYAIEQEKARAA